MLDNIPNDDEYLFAFLSNDIFSIFDIKFHSFDLFFLPELSIFLLLHFIRWNLSFECIFAHEQNIDRLLTPILLRLFFVVVSCWVSRSNV